MVTYLFLTFLLNLAKKGCTFYKRLAFWVWKWWSFDLTFFFVFQFFKEKNFYFPDTLVSNFVDILQYPKTGGASSNAVPQAPSILPKSGAGAIAFHLRPCLVYNSKTFITSFFTKNKDFFFNDNEKPYSVKLLFLQSNHGNTQHQCTHRDFRLWRIRVHY